MDYRPDNRPDCSARRTIVVFVPLHFGVHTIGGLISITPLAILLTVAYV